MRCYSPSDSGVYAYSWDGTPEDPTLYYETEVGNATFLWRAVVSGGKLSKGVFDAGLGGVEKNSLVLISKWCVRYGGSLIRYL